MNRILFGCITVLAAAATSQAAEVDWAKVDQAVGRKGAELPGGVHKYAFLRSDLKVTVDGISIKPALALGGWAAFLAGETGTMLMGDLVLTDTEISPVMQRLVADGIQITAVHNHLLRTSVPVFYMHIEGHGEPVGLGQSLTAALSLSATPMSAAAPAPSTSVDLDTAEIDKTLGYKGKVNGGVYQVSVPRQESISEGAMPLPAPMGTAIAINFQPAANGQAATTGDFVLLGSEVNPVLKTLRSHGIEVTALHSHMIDESPRLYFMHFWAHDGVQKLTRGLRAALDLVNVKHGS